MFRNAVNSLALRGRLVGAQATPGPELAGALETILELAALVPRKRPTSTKLSSQSKPCPYFCCQSALIRRATNASR
jgi:hypothetical protein